MSRKTVALIISTLVTNLVLVMGQNQPCQVKFENVGRLIEAGQSCIESTRLQLPNIFGSDDAPEKFLADFEKSGFDDKCFSKCLADKFKLITADGKLDRAEFAKMIKNDGSPKMNKAIDDIWIGCADKIEEKAKTDSALNQNVCKKAGMFKHCLASGFLNKQDVITSCS